MSNSNNNGGCAFGMLTMCFMLLMLMHGMLLLNREQLRNDLKFANDERVKLSDQLTECQRKLIDAGIVVSP